MKKPARIAFFIAVLGFLALYGTAWAYDVHVPGPYSITIQIAINWTEDGDTVIIAPGTYTGVGNRDIDFKGKAITVRSIDPQDPCIVAATIIDVNSYNYGFDFYRGETSGSVLDGLTITNSIPYISSLRRSLIRCYRSSPVIRNCRIINNKAKDGAGIYCDGYRSGGGMWASESPAIINCTISNNTADRYGGGIYCTNGSRPTIEKCTITGNSAGTGGGGIYIDAGSGAKIKDCIFTANSAQDGGAIYRKTNTPLDIIQSDIVANSATNLGGGVFCDGDKPIQLTNCILWANSDSSGTALSAHIYAANKEAIFSCIGDDDPNDDYIPFGDANEQNIDDYPVFVRDPNDGADGWGVGDNDDFGDLHLRSDSPCINAGHPIFSESLEKDIDGQPRIIGGRIDMGADEFELKMITVTRPKAGDVWTRNSRHEIKWTACGIENVDILFSKDNGGTWQSIESGIASSSYMWELPNVQSGQCIISIVPAIPDPNVICIASGTFEIKHYPNRPPAPPGQARKNKWGRTGLSEYYGPQLGCVKWRLETAGPVTSASADGGGNRIYVGSEDGKLYALEKDSGALIWSYDTNSPILGSPATGYYGMVYVGCEDGKLYAIDSDGNLKWTHTADAEIYSSPVVSPDGGIYVCSQDGIVHALGHNGSELWKFEIGGVDVSDANLVAHWRFDENTGTTAADSAGGNDGTIHAAEWTAGRINSGLRFLQPGPIVDIPDFDLSGNWTISLWVEASGEYYYTDNYTILGNPGDQSNIFRLVKAYSWDPWEAEFVNSSGVSVQWPFLKLDAFYCQWRLITLVANETQIELFIDGVSRGVRTIEPTLKFHDIGGGLWYQDPGIIDIDEVRLYNRPLSSDEVRGLKDFGVLRGAFFASPTVGADGTVSIGGLYDPELYALNPADGSLKWACNFESEINLEGNPYYSWLRYLHTKTGWPFASPVTAQDGTIYQTLLYDPNLYAIDANSGNILWSTNLADSETGWFDCKYDENCLGIHRPGCYYAFRYFWRADGWSEPAVGPDGTIYVSLDDPYLRAVDPNGSIKWITRLGMVGGFTLTVGSDGLIYAAGDDGHLYVVNADGEQIALFQSDTPLSSPVIAQDGLVIVSDANNTVWAIGGDDCQTHELHRPPDLNGDNVVNFTDFGILAADWLCCTDKEMDLINELYLCFPGIPDCNYNGDDLYLQGDVDRDLHIDAADLAEVANRWLIED